MDDDPSGEGGRDEGVADGGGKDGAGSDECKASDEGERVEDALGAGEDGGKGNRREDSEMDGGSEGVIID